ncbi:pyrimidine reductase [Cellulomonas chitinilytica]|uniref:Pyrimidine reductase n=1 Tax=Cellulomonas chitinilytica TaxID=398759 RepID=A0A919P309_9CELL|nr:dihydrofolate reductase family protein [Cellulomonas chitinilytica]GIG22392.1 pyrimidine reductase [Cellulomonas chitinilytica]
MGRIVAVEYLTLDGVFEDPSWTQPYFDDAVAAFQGEAMRWADALLLGRVTYDGMSVAWPATGDDPSTGGDIMNSIGKYVPTSTLTEPTWNTTFLSGDVVEAVTGLKAGDENLVVYGSGQLTETLRAAGLVDEYRLLVCPVVRGEGRRLFTGSASSTFTVADSRTSPTGVTLLTLTAG